MSDSAGHTMNPEETLAAGCEILDSLLVSAGYQFISGNAGKSSGGRFASGAYVRNERKLELHFRHSLGLVTYRFREFAAPHESIIRALGAFGAHKYPGFSDESLDSFRQLRSDIESFFQIFISGSDADLCEVLALAQQKEVHRPKGFRGIL